MICAKAEITTDLYSDVPGCLKIRAAICDPDLNDDKLY